MEKEKIVKSTQEQAVASWINYLNQVRISELLSNLSKEQLNLDNAMEEIRCTLKTISEDIVNKGHGRGGTKGMHGFIAEISECGIGNARNLIEGKIPIYEWINDNDVVDIIRGEDLIQQKFSAAGGHLSLKAILQHKEMYPYFLECGGKYQIPKDHYDRIKWLLSISKERANKMGTEAGEFSLKQWKEVHEFFSSGSVPLEAIEPSLLKYGEVQKATYVDTFAREQESLEKINEERVKQAYIDGKPGLSEGLKAAGISAVLEGSTSGIIEIIKIRKTGKQFGDFDSDDWRAVLGESGKGIAKGSVRGAGIYVITNYSATPAAVANSIITASFGVAEQAYLLRKGELSGTQFIENSEMLCLDATVSAVSSLAGQVLIPIPVLGAVIGNSVGTLMYQIAKEYLSDVEEQLVSQYIKEIAEVTERLDLQYKKVAEELSLDFQEYICILDKAFCPDINSAFIGSVELAKMLGVPTSEILDTKEKVITYFMD